MIVIINCKIFIEERFIVVTFHSLALLSYHNRILFECHNCAITQISDFDIYFCTVLLKYLKI